MPCRQILGIDAAVDPRNIGFALLEHRSGRWRVTAAQTGTKDSDPAEAAHKLLNIEQPLLVAIDAPLGWPEALKDSLGAHQAGTAMAHEANELFARDTDRHVQKATGRKPLDVGADRIARTAKAALDLVARLRGRLGTPLEMIASPSQAAAGGLIEVYPAATLAQRGLPSRGYKKAGGEQIRRGIVDEISAEIDFGEYRNLCIESDHCLDAVICALTGVDFLSGRCEAPPSIDTLRSEGWIWFPR